MEQNQGTGGQHGTYMGQGQQNGGGQAGRVDQGPGFQILHYDIRNQQFAPQPEPRADQPEPNSLQPPAMQKYMHNNMVQRPSFQGMPIHMLQPQHTGHDPHAVHPGQHVLMMRPTLAEQQHAHANLLMEGHLRAQHQHPQQHPHQQVADQEEQHQQGTAGEQPEPMETDPGPDASPHPSPNPGPADTDGASPPIKMGPGAVVWARIPPFPYWPARVEPDQIDEVSPEEFAAESAKGNPLVVFFGSEESEELEFGFIPWVELVPWQTGLDKLYQFLPNENQEVQDDVARSYNEAIKWISQQTQKKNQNKSRKRRAETSLVEPRSICGAKGTRGPCKQPAGSCPYHKLSGDGERPGSKSGAGTSRQRGAKDTGKSDGIKDTGQGDLKQICGVISTRGVPCKQGRLVCPYHRKDKPKAAKLSSPDEFEDEHWSVGSGEEDGYGEPDHNGSTNGEARKSNMVAILQADLGPYWQKEYMGSSLPRKAGKNSSGAVKHELNAQGQSICGASGLGGPCRQLAESCPYHPVVGQGAEMESADPRLVDLVAWMRQLEEDMVQLWGLDHESSHSVPESVESFLDQLQHSLAQWGGFKQRQRNDQLNGPMAEVMALELLSGHQTVTQQLLQGEAATRAGTVSDSDLLCLLGASQSAMAVARQQRPITNLISAQHGIVSHLRQELRSGEDKKNSSAAAYNTQLGRLQNDLADEESNLKSLHSQKSSLQAQLREVETRISQSADAVRKMSADVTRFGREHKRAQHQSEQHQASRETRHKLAKHEVAFLADLKGYLRGSSRVLHKRCSSALSQAVAARVQMVEQHLAKLVQDPLKQQDPSPNPHANPCPAQHDLPVSNQDTAAAADADLPINPPPAAAPPPPPSASEPAGLKDSEEGKAGPALTAPGPAAMEEEGAGAAEAVGEEESGAVSTEGATALKAATVLRDQCDLDLTTAERFVGVCELAVKELELVKLIRSCLVLEQLPEAEQELLVQVPDRYRAVRDTCIQHFNQSNDASEPRAQGQGLTEVIWDERCLNHMVPEDHPEQPARVSISIQVLKQLVADHDGHEDRIRMTESVEPVKQELIQLVHQPRYLHTLHQAFSHAPSDPSVLSTFRADVDTFVTLGTKQAVLVGAGACVHAVDQVMTGAVKNAFCCTRPPGHHAGRAGIALGANSQGFCLLNNVCIGAAHARIRYPGKVRRVVVVDFDVHHGNGTEDILFDDTEALFLSVHRHGEDFFPQSGDNGHNGSALNIGLDQGYSGSMFRAAFEETILPNCRQFKPDLIFISAGFDSHYLDPIGGAALHEDEFAWATLQLMQAADDLCEGRVVSCMEGGYDANPDGGIASSVKAHVKALCGLCELGEVAESRVVVNPRVQKELELEAEEQAALAECNTTEGGAAEAGTNAELPEAAVYVGNSPAFHQLSTQSPAKPQQPRHPTEN